MHGWCGRDLLFGQPRAGAASATNVLSVFGCVLALLLLGGCAAREEDPDYESDADVERRYEYFPPAEPQSCISVRTIRNVDPVGNHSLLFYMDDGKIWRSRMRSRCLSMRRGVVLSYQVRTGRLCAGDIVDLLDRYGSSMEKIGACALGEFDYLTEEQAEAFQSYQ